MRKLGFSEPVRVEEIDASLVFGPLVAALLCVMEEDDAAPEPFTDGPPRQRQVRKATIPIVTIGIPTGAEGPLHPMRSMREDPYFCRWFGRAAWHASTRRLYVDPKVGMERTRDVAGEIVAFLEGRSA